MSERPSVAIAGGGLAGLAAACELADAGFRVTLLEKRPFLGGRAYSYTDKATGTVVDNGQHVFLGCCTEYIRFIERIGARAGVHLQKRFRVRVIDKIWGESVLSSAPLPPPGHLAPSLLGFKPLSPLEKALAAYAFSAIQRLDRRAHPELDDVTFEDWLLQHRQSPHAIRSLWNLIVQPTLNDDTSRVSADLALMVFQEGFLRSWEGANIGWAKVGLTDLIGQTARRYIEERGGEVRLDASVRSLTLADGRVAAMRTDEGDVTAGAYIVALPVERVLDVFPEPLRDEPLFSRIREFETSPIVNVHLWYDRPVWDGRFAAFLNTPVQWVFNKSRMLGDQSEGQYLDISLSGAHEFVDIPNAELVALFAKEMMSLFPAARGAEITRAIVVKQRDATFSARPGVRRFRPAQQTPVSNLVLAGDWTDTGWPATMESAVRSGLLAARAVMRQAEGSRAAVARV